MKTIPLTRGKFAIVDDDKYEELSKYKWFAVKGRRNRFYARRSTYKETKKSTVVSMSHMVLKLPKGMCADHIDHNTLDNRVTNLRPATNSQNLWNSPKRKLNSTSIYKGVSWNKKGHYWHVELQANNVVYNLGRYAHEKTAAKQYDKLAKLVHGEFACLNFPT